MPFQFRFHEVGGDGKAIGITLVDGVQGYVEVGLRGTGVRRLLSLMGLLLQQVNPEEQTVLLLDEPETSLHADAQHQLRRTLEGLGSNPRVQVVYATHSPAMVNPAYPDRVRVFCRQTSGEIGTSKVENLSHGENFQQVRVSLGLTPSDSLLYGLVTVIVEGDTEVRCIGPLLRKLDRDGIDGFQGMSQLLESSHFVCGWGSSIHYYCKLARDQNGRPIAFLDGDKRREGGALRQDGIPTIELPKGTEFEEIVPKSLYIRALAEEAGALDLDAAELTIDAYNEWLAASSLPASMFFSKRVDAWVQSVLGRGLSKHAVMERAIALTPSAEVHVTTLRELAAAIRNEFERA
jgi:hypothetical protein